MALALRIKRFDIPEGTDPLTWLTTWGCVRLSVCTLRFKSPVTNGTIVVNRDAGDSTWNPT